MSIPEAYIQDFLRTTKDVIHLREIDRILIIRPNKIQHLNESAFEMLDALYNKKRPANTIISALAKKYRISAAQLEGDLLALLQSIRAIMSDDYSAPMIDTIDFDPDSISFPVLSEIALTYRCQNRCDFCYASSPYRGQSVAEMSTSQVKVIIDKIFHEAHVPTVSFTGGEPTLRDDLPELIRYAQSIGMRTNLITNGIRCADKEYCAALADAGLKSAQVSLESHRESLHNSIVGNRHAYRRTLQGVHSLKEAGIHTHTNTTICQKNRDTLIPFVGFIKKEFDPSYLSMNMIIKTGMAKIHERDITYSSIGELIKPVINFCETVGITFVWYSPTPYCIFNPVDHNLGSKSCACVSGLLSVNPAGDIIPCSSFDRGIGNLLKHSFEYIWNSDEALYWRDRKYIPPVCRGCEYEILCGGACPLYWETAGSFKEIETVIKKKPKLKNVLWSLEKFLRVKTRGVMGFGSEADGIPSKDSRAQINKSQEATHG
jgi:radical SAM protein with 4Fe4S-binding SPASM domain